MFTRKHYKAMAEIIRRNTRTMDLDQFGTLDYIRAEDLIDEVSDMFREDNSRFDKDRFVEACVGE